jgi:hypothetical protein
MKDEKEILENMRKIGLRFDGIEEFSLALRKGIDNSDPKFFSHTMFKRISKINLHESSNWRYSE